MCWVATVILIRLMERLVAMSVTVEMQCHGMQFVAVC
jgi:hypothetical protein